MVSVGLDSQGAGLLISASRSVIYASSGADFAEAARREAQRLRDEIEDCGAGGWRQLRRGMNAAWATQSIWHDRHCELAREPVAQEVSRGMDCISAGAEERYNDDR